jgi:hypothetical protein
MADSDFLIDAIAKYSLNIVTRKNADGEQHYFVTDQLLFDDGNRIEIIGNAVWHTNLALAIQYCATAIKRGDTDYYHDGII